MPHGVVPGIILDEERTKNDMKSRLPQPSILIVDDERAVRDWIHTELARAGYAATTAASGKEALRLITETGLRIHLLITDVLMPSMNGKELANRICELRPSVRVLFISAYSADILTGYGICPEGVDLLRKPFNAAALRAGISRILAVSPTWRELTNRAA